MQIARMIAVATVLATVGAARAQSPIPSNYVDDFGLERHGDRAEPSVPAAPGASARPMLGWSPTGSPFPGNYVDDFSVVAPEPSGTPMVASTSPGAGAAER
jgi:hypothetical protein